jgi:hypothetical protein
MSSAQAMRSLLAVLPGENCLVLPPNFSPAAVKEDEGVFLLACVPPLTADRGEVHYAVQRYRFSPLLGIIGKGDRVTDKEAWAVIGEALIESDGASPCVDAILYAYLLSLPGISYVLQGVSVAVSQILCSPRGREFAKHRILPEETMACGVGSLFIPYADPGWGIAQSVRSNLEAYRMNSNSSVRVLLLQNRGFLVMGGEMWEVLRSYFTLEKAAQVWLGAALLGGPTFLTAPSVIKLMQFSESFDSEQMGGEFISGRRDVDNKQVLSFSGKPQDEKVRPTLGKDNYEQQDVVKNISGEKETLVVREEVPLFEEDQSEDYKNKLNFTRRVSNKEG